MDAKRLGTRIISSVVCVCSGLALAATPAAIAPPELVVQSGHASPVNAVSFSADGKLLASGTGKDWSLVEVNVVKVWEVATGRELRTFWHDDEPVVWVAFSEDGRRVAARGPGGISPGTTRVWDVASGQVIEGAQEVQNYVSRTQTPDGALAASIDVKNIHIRDAATGRHLRTLASRTSDFQKAMFSPDGKILATGGNRFSIRLWDLGAGVLRTLEGHTHIPVVADFSPDSKLLASGGYDLVVRLWDVAAGRQLKALAGHDSRNIRGMHFNPNGKSLLSFDTSGFKLWDVETGRELASGRGEYDDEMRRVVFGPQGHRLAAVTERGIEILDGTTGEQIHLFPGSGGSLSFSEDGKRLLADAMFSAELFDLVRGEKLATIKPEADGTELGEALIIRGIFSPDSCWLALAEFDSREEIWQWTVRLFDAATGAVERKFVRDANTVDPYGGLLFSPDSQKFANDGSGGQHSWLVANGEPTENFPPPRTNFGSADGRYKHSIGQDGELILLDAATDRPLISLIGIDETDWLVATPEGFFDGSPPAWKQISWRFNQNAFDTAPVEQFFNEFYHPGLLADILAGRVPTAPSGKELSRVDRRQPTVSITSIVRPNTPRSNPRFVTLTLEVAESSETAQQKGHPATSGARDIRLFRNGLLIKAWRGDAFRLAEAQGCTQLPSRAGQPRRVRCEVTVPIVAGANEFTAYAFNSANVKSSDATAIASGEESLRRKPTFHHLAIGINKYEDPRFNLHYAENDAKRFFDTVQQQQMELGQCGVLEKAILLDSAATKRNIMEVLSKFARKAQPEDMVVVYFAGHGVSRQNQFYLLPYDIGAGSKNAPNLQEVLRHGIADRELEVAFERINAAHFLFVVDSCNSGQLLEAADSRRGPMNSKGLAQLAYEKGAHILTAAQHFETAGEFTKLEHGLLTHALVNEGIKGGAADALPSDRRITMREWLDYATRRVPQLQQRVEQRPRVFYRREIEHDPWVIASLKEAVRPETQEPLADTDKPTIPIAIAAQTIADEPLPDALREEWENRIRGLFKGDLKKLSLVDRPEDAKWLVQVAALERCDIVYLRPQSSGQEEFDEGLLRMSLPGEQAMTWLKDELLSVVHGRSFAENSLQEATRGARGFLGLTHKGPAEDLKAEVVQEQSGIYHTPNRTQAVLGSYGKLIASNKLKGQLPKFEQRSLVQQVDQVRRFVTVQRQGKGSGKDLVSFVGNRQAWQVVDLAASASGGKQNEVSFEIMGLRLDQNDLIRALNADQDALLYFDYLAKNQEIPCLVLENLVFTNYSSSKTTNVNLGLNAKMSLTGDGGGGKWENQRVQSTQFNSPVIRGYQMYQVKLHQGRVMELVAVEP